MGNRQDAKKAARRWAALLAPYLIVFLLCALNGWFEYTRADFSPIDGTFQNYNVWRRVLDGQALFSEFGPFYGVGQTLLGAAVTGLLGGSYSACLQAAEFLTMLMFSAFAYVTVYCIVEKCSPWARLQRRGV